MRFTELGDGYHWDLVKTIHRQLESDKSLNLMLYFKMRMLCL